MLGRKGKMKKIIKIKNVSKVYKTGEKEYKSDSS